MNDKELLEFAAKAAGIQICNTWLSDEGRAWSSVWAKDFNGAPTTKLWNPLGNDGDAFRLSVGLNLCVEVNGMFVHADMRNCVTDHGYVEENTARNSGCILTATRRAIVRAAAVIGESMP